MSRSPVQGCPPLGRARSRAPISRGSSPSAQDRHLHRPWSCPRQPKNRSRPRSLLCTRPDPEGRSDPGGPRHGFTAARRNTAVAASVAISARDSRRVSKGAQPQLRTTGTPSRRLVAAKSPDAIVAGPSGYRGRDRRRSRSPLVIGASRVSTLNGTVAARSRGRSRHA
jgi:hypothetical protein